MPYQASLSVNNMVSTPPAPQNMNCRSTGTGPVLQKQRKRNNNNKAKKCTCTKANNPKVVNGGQQAKNSNATTATAPKEAAVSQKPKVGAKADVQTSTADDNPVFGPVDIREGGGCAGEGGHAFVPDTFEARPTDPNTETPNSMYLWATQRADHYRRKTISRVGPGQRIEDQELVNWFNAITTFENGGQRRGFFTTCKALKSAAAAGWDLLRGRLNTVSMRTHCYRVGLRILADPAQLRAWKVDNPTFNPVPGVSVSLVNYFVDTYFRTKGRPRYTASQYLVSEALLCDLAGEYRKENPDVRLADIDVAQNVALDVLFIQTDDEVARRLARALNMREGLLRPTLPV